MKLKILLGALLVTSIGFSQTNEIDQKESNENLKENVNSPVSIRGYGQIDYNQPEGVNGELDVHRMVLLFAYRFNDKVQFLTEIEFEHVKEVYIEQAYLNYSLSDNFAIKGGLMLVPMGIVNEYHEPTTFNGVERPSMDKSIVPTTWREIGIGINGKVDDANLKYQAYLFNGFASVNGSKVLGGSNGLRNGRQKGAESTVNSPNLSAKVDYYGIQGLRLGLSGYFGRTQSEDGMDAIDGADVGVSMIGLDARYAVNRFSARGQYVNAAIKDSEDYNTLHTTDLGSSLNGWYLEAAYNLLSLEKEQKLNAFVRYEEYDTHASVDGDLVKNNAYDRNEVTFGLSYHIAPGAVVKADYQILDNAVVGNESSNKLNIGLGVNF